MDEEIQPKARIRRGFLPRALFWVCGIFFVLLFFDGVVFAGFARLIFGWLILLRENFVEIHIVPHRIASALILAVLAVAGLHFIARRWRRWARPEEIPWRWAWSISISAILLSTALAAMAVAGAAHQVAWLKSEPISGSRISQARNFNYAKQIALIAFDHSERHEGRFPDDITTPIKEEIGTEDGQGLIYFLFYQENSHTTPEPWLYFGAGRSHQEGESFLLLAAPRASKGKRIVVDTSGRARVVPEEEFITMLEKQPLPSELPDSTR